MWENTEAADSAAEQDERYPYYPVDAGNPITAAMFAVLLLGLISATFLVVP